MKNRRKTKRKKIRGKTAQSDSRLHMAQIEGGFVADNNCMSRNTENSFADLHKPGGLSVNEVYVMYFRSLSTGNR